MAKNYSVSRTKMAAIFILSIVKFCTVQHVQSVPFGRADYLDALTKSILFYEGQRSGPLPSTQRMNWRGSSGLQDGKKQGVDLVGGYYDAGDNIKFLFPMAFTTTLLSWSVVEGKAELAQAGELIHAQEAVRWATDFLLKTYNPATETLWAQVGDMSDHQCWERPELMDTPRNAYALSPQKPGSDAAAETAAALAAASVVFTTSDPAYSATLLRTAEMLFEFANKYKGRYSDSLEVVAPFYKSYSGYEDELLWAAAWLQKATGKSKYLDYLMSNGEKLGGTTTTFTACDWDNKYPCLQVLVSQLLFATNNTSLQGYKQEADDFVCSILPNTRMTQEKTTPGGLLFIMSGTNLQYVTSDAFLLLAYARYLIPAKKTVLCEGQVVQPSRLISFAKQQVDYILGNNPQNYSYMVGFGKTFPQRIHHRGSSIPSTKVHPEHIPCGQSFTYYQSSKPNPNILHGAVVGGPSSLTDAYADERSNYEQSEPATYVNSGMVGALALLSSSS